jgi:hypothetical protein
MSLPGPICASRSSGTRKGFSRLGDENVLSIDVDPQLVSSARTRLDRLGYFPTLASGDGAEGIPEYAPFDRIIATCSMFAVPAAWINQLCRQGLILVHIEDPLGSGNLTALRRTAVDTVEGKFLPWWGCFMRRRPLHGPSVGDPRPARTGIGQTTRRSMVDPAELDGGKKFSFLAQLYLPHGVFRSIWQSEDGETVTELRAPDGSWCEVVREPDSDGCHAVREAGPTALWKSVEEAWQSWLDLNAPALHEFGITATPSQQKIWLGNPHGPQWSLPMPPLA